MLKKIINIFVIAVTVFSLCGCSFFAPYKQSVYINGTPADATVVVNGAVTKIPATLEVPRNKNLTIIAHKDGYETYKVTTGYSLNTIGTLDAIGCYLLLLPGLGMLSPGAWELSQNNFYYVLTPVKAKK